MIHWGTGCLVSFNSDLVSLWMKNNPPLSLPLIIKSIVIVDGHIYDTWKSHVKNNIGSVGHCKVLTPKIL